MPLPRPDVNAKRMFIVGLLGLPWLWTVNVLYHYKAVYGKGTTEDTTNEEDNDDDENEGILGGMMSSNDDENGKLRLQRITAAFLHHSFTHFSCIRISQPMRRYQKK
jgi:hypothetical protein